MKEEFEKEKQVLEQEIDELKVQLALGKTEAADYLENKKSEFSGFIDEVKKKLLGSDSAAGEGISRLHGKLDELKLQLALGRMESQDAYSAQRVEIVGAIDQVHGQWSGMGEHGKDDIRELRESFTEHAGQFKTKLESAAINLGAGAKLATHEVEHAVETLNEKLHRISHMTADEVREARNYVKGRIALRSEKTEA